MKHYSEADLLETYYMQPGESMPVMMHLADCSECAARYEKLETKIRAAAGCPAEKPETFWSRQRIAVMRRIAERPRRTGIALQPALRVAAAAILAFVLGGAAMYRHMTTRVPSAEAQKAPVVATTETAKSQQTPQLDPQGRMDPWESGELREFHAVVEWESWVPEAHDLTGDDAL